MESVAKSMWTPPAQLKPCSVTHKHITLFYSRWITPQDTCNVIGLYAFKCTLKLCKVEPQEMNKQLIWELINHSSNLSSKHAEHYLVPAFHMWGFSAFFLSYLIVKWICLGFGLLLKHNKKSEDMNLSFRKLRWAFFTTFLTLFWHNKWTIRKIVDGLIVNDNNC